MSKLNVLVVGASIAGPMTAYWFARAGAKVTVIERFSKFRTNGQNIDIRTVGVTVMRKIPGMEAAVQAKTMALGGISLVRENGRPYGTIIATGNPDQQSLVSEYEIFRGDLAQILFDLTKENENVKYVFGEQIASIQQDRIGNGPVTVEFTNGLPTSKYDLIVACDGATSRTRSLALGCGVRDHIESMNCWAAYFSLKEDLLKGSNIGQAYNAIRGRFIALGPDPSGGNRVLMMCLRSRSNHGSMLPFRDAMKQGDIAIKEHVAQHFRGIGWKTDKILDSILESQDFYANEIVQVKTQRLFEGRFVLVGDAGYAPGLTGTGTSLAMAGAYILAGEICKHKGNLEAGLEGYETHMRPLIGDLQKIPPFITTFVAPQTAWGIWLRNHIFALIVWTRILELAQKFFANSFASNDESKLPDYDWVE